MKLVNEDRTQIVGIDYLLPFGKHKGRFLGDLLIIDPQYILWLSENNVIRIEPSIVQSAEIEAEELDDFKIDYPHDFMAEDWGDRD